MQQSSGIAVKDLLLFRFRNTLEGKKTFHACFLVCPWGVCREEDLVSPVAAHDLRKQLFLDLVDGKSRIHPDIKTAQLFIGLLIMKVVSEMSEDQFWRRKFSENMQDHVGSAAGSVPGEYEVGYTDD